MWGLPPLAFNVPTVGADTPSKTPDQLANDRVNEQAKHDGKRWRRPPERFISASAIITIETTDRFKFPNLVRGCGEGVKPDETAVQFADRVRDELIKLQGGAVPEVKP